jgi:hypothetical protein
MAASRGRSSETTRRSGKSRARSDDLPTCRGPVSTTTGRVATDSRTESEIVLSYQMLAKHGFESSISQTHATGLPRPKPADLWMAWRASPKMEREGITRPSSRRFSWRCKRESADAAVLVVPRGGGQEKRPRGPVSTHAEFLGMLGEPARVGHAALMGSPTGHATPSPRSSSSSAAMSTSSMLNEKTSAFCRRRSGFVLLGSTG